MLTAAGPRSSRDNGGSPTAREQPLTAGAGCLYRPAMGTFPTGHRPPAPRARPAVPERAGKGLLGDDLTPQGLLAGVLVGVVLLYLPLVWAVWWLAGAPVGTWPTVVGMALGAVLLALPQTRRAGAGFVAGLVIGVLATHGLVWWWLSSTLPG